MNELHNLSANDDNCLSVDEESTSHNQTSYAGMDGWKRRGGGPRMQVNTVMIPSNCWSETEQREREETPTSVE